MIKLVITITGGPCSGKSSSKATVSEAIMKAGYSPIFIDECATRIILSGIPLNGIEFDVKTSQELLTNLQNMTEFYYKKALSQSEKEYVLVLDRGLLDAKAYMPEETWKGVLKETGLTELEIYGKYHLVIHLQTAAYGAEKFYTSTTENQREDTNSARAETLEEARARDDAIKRAYYGHPHIVYIGNECMFDEKLRAIGNTVLSALGKAQPIYGKQKKYLVKKVSHQYLEQDKGIQAQSLELKQTYLQTVDPQLERRIRRVNYLENSIYYYTEKGKDRLVIPGRDMKITKDEYLRYQEQKLPGTSPITKQRWYFSINNLYYQYDEFPEWNQYAILEVQITNLQKEIVIPEGMEVIRDVTFDTSLCNASLAKKFIKESDL